MFRLCAMLVLFSSFGTVLPASDFDWLVREFARESGAKQVHVPFLGFARFLVVVGHPAGTTDMRLAIFERGDLETLRFSDLTDSTVGDSWSPMIRVRSKRGESTNIYGRSDRKHLRLLITTLDGDDATFVQVNLEPKALIRFIDDHSGNNR
ncbi:MAG TPA: hypothetical protein VHZ55_15825 [Bryobacteraceae bacterium]|jgi:hypothetical protein|nr:hypothetical protein [Bryobacteraceae bacterium]